MIIDVSKFRMNNIDTISLGFQRENEVTSIVFDYSAWVEKYGVGLLSLLHTRSGDSIPYPVTMTATENTAEWIVTNGDTYYEGIGEGQLTYTVDGVVKKTVVFKTKVERSLIEEGETPPDPYISWFEQILAEAESVHVDALRAKASADNASTSEQNAKSSEDNALASEQNAKVSEDNAKASEDNAKASETSAEDSAERAEEALAQFNDVTAEAVSVSPSTPADVDYDSGHFTFKIPQGEKGDRGEKGETGETGETGAVPDFEIGTVETLDPDQSATATITGTAENPVLNLGIPQGKTGEVTYEDLASLLPRDTASGSLVTIPDGQSVIPVESLKVSLEPIQEGTPWMDTDVYSDPYLFKASPQLSEEYNSEDNKIVGGTVAWNQLCPDRIVGGTVSENGVTMVNKGNGIVSFSGTATGNGIFYLNGSIYPMRFLKNHNYLLWFNPIGAVNNDVIGRFVPTSIDIRSGGKIIKPTSDTSTAGVFRANVLSGAELSDYDVHIACFDLTQMFGSTIADYIYSLEQANAGAGVAWFKKLFPKDYYEYNAGELISVEGLSAHVMRDADDNVIGNYPLDNSLTLRGIPKLDANNNLYYDGDEYASDGSVVRKYGVVDLGTLNWSKYNATSEAVGEQYIYGTTGLNGLNKATAPVDVTCVSNKYQGALNVTSNMAAWQRGDKTCYMLIGNGDRRLYVRDDSLIDKTPAEFKTAMSGVYLVYELATPTTETATAYTNPQSVEPYGTEEYVTTSIVPVGHKTRYMRIAPISGYTEVDTFVSPTTSETDATKYTTQLPQTVYGGTLDVVSGELVVDKGYIASYNGETLPSTWISDRDVYASGTTPTIGAEVVYELATPQTIQLTPQEVSLILGTNNVWSDGDVTMVYSADTALWIEKKMEA